MPTPLIIARSFREAHAFAKDTLDLRVGHYRVVNTAGTLKAVRNVDVHLVPGWDKAPGHHAFKTALRYAKGLNVIDHSQPKAEPEDRWADIEYAHKIALRANSLREFFPARIPVWTIIAVPDDTEVPQHHVDMVAKVLPGRETDFFDGVEVPPLPPEEPEPTATCVDCGLIPCEDDCKAAVAPEAIAQVTQDDEPEAEKPKAKRRSRCKSCGSLHYKDEPCPEDD